MAVGKCAKCHKGWNEVRPADHKVTENSSVFIFCEQCDTEVTLTERWNAFDRWKGEIIQSFAQAFPEPHQLLSEVRRVLDFEFIEFPREK